MGRRGKLDRYLGKEREARSLFGEGEKARSLFGEGEEARSLFLERRGKRDRCFWEGERGAIAVLRKGRKTRYDQEKQEIFFIEART